VRDASKRPCLVPSPRTRHKVQRLGDTLDGLRAEIFDIERAAEQPVGYWRDDDLVGAGDTLHTGGEIGSLADRVLGQRGVAVAGLADHHRTGGDADAHLQRGEHVAHACRQGHILDRGDDIESGADRARGVFFMRGGPAEISHQAVAEILRDVAVITLDHRAGGGLIAVHDGAQVFRVEHFGQRGRADQIAEHHRDLASLGLAPRRLGCRIDDVFVEQFRGPQELLARPHRQAEIAEIVLGQLGNMAQRNILAFERGVELAETQTVEPFAQCRHFALSNDLDDRRIVGYAFTRACAPRTSTPGKAPVASPSHETSTPDTKVYR